MFSVSDSVKRSIVRFCKCERGDLLQNILIVGIIAVPVAVFLVQYGSDIRGYMSGQSSTALDVGTGIAEGDTGIGN